MIVFENNKLQYDKLFNENFYKYISLEKNHWKKNHNKFIIGGIKYAFLKKYYSLTKIHVKKKNKWKNYMFNDLFNMLEETNDCNHTLIFLEKYYEFNKKNVTNDTNDANIYLASYLSSNFIEIFDDQCHVNNGELYFQNSKIIQIRTELVKKQS